jgi:signal transduction histidine kinase
MALLHEEPRAATVRARTPLHLIAIPKAALDDLLSTSAKASRAVFQPLVRRVRETNDQLRHQERMVQLGVMTAGVAHELNNPAAAVQRAAEQLSEEVLELVSLAGDGSFRAAYELLEEVDKRPRPQRSAIEASDEEAALEDWLDDHEIEDGWKLAPALVAAGVTADDLGRLGEPADLSAAVRFLASAATVRRSAMQMAEGSRRLSEIVGALRSYSYLDRAPLQEVDVVAGIEDTLTVMAHATAGIRIVREYAEGLPTIVGLGAELNQVWTNLIHNAADALADTSDPTITVRAFPEGEAVVVEIEDNGPGIPPEIQSRVFDAFFTTKPPGQGTGLGLQVSYRVVVLEHSGDLTVSSEPGRTTFRVSLPVQASTADQPPQDERTESVSANRCEHLEAVENTPKPEGGCEQCLAAGDTWVHLRFCVECGQVGCCNDSKNKHASRHAAESGHPVMRTKEPDENWAWCFVDEMGVRLD